MLRIVLRVKPQVISRVKERHMSSDEQNKRVFQEARNSFRKYELDPAWRQARLGNYVAMIGPALVDEDADLMTLARKVHEKYPQVSVFIDKVGGPYIGTDIHLRSRIARPLSE